MGALNPSVWILLQHEQEFHFLLPHCVLLLILWGGNSERGQSGPSLPALWPWVSDRYKSVGAGQHSSEQVNRASSNPPGSLSLLGLNNGFYKCWHLQTRTVCHSAKQNWPVSKREFCKWQHSALPRQHLLLCGSNRQWKSTVFKKQVEGRRDMKTDKVQILNKQSHLHCCQVTQLCKTSYLRTCEHCTRTNSQ